MTKHPFFPLYMGIVAVILLAAANGLTIAATPPTTPDVTVMPCSAWADDADPVIPPNTLTDACVDERGTLHTAPTSTDLTTAP